jgi:hypothetical protein
MKKKYKFLPFPKGHLMGPRKWVIKYNNLSMIIFSEGGESELK